MTTISPPANDDKINYQSADYDLGPTVVWKFVPRLADANTTGCWDPEHQVVLVEADRSGVELAQTLLHEVGHMICADHGDVLTDDEHDRLEEWAGQSARLLALLRPGRRALPVAV